MVLEFLEDYKVWSDFASSEYAKSSRFTLADKAYDALILKYCGPGKDRRLITFSSDPSFNPQTDTITDVDRSEDIVVVRVKHGNRGWDECIYEFDFQFHGDRWVLDEVYYLDEFDQNARLKML